MRREGRAHGMVRTYHVLPSSLNPKNASRIINKIDSPPTAGLFTKISNKPSNHSKFTGKCGKIKCSDCHHHPVCKSRDKSKGVRKLKSPDAAVNFQLNTLRLMGLNKLRDSGHSASGILHELDTNYHYFYNNDDYHDDDDDDYENDDDDFEDDEQEKRELTLVETMRDDNDDVGNNNVEDLIIHVGVTDDCDDGYMGFYDVAYVLSSVEVEDEGWSIVGGDQI